MKNSRLWLGILVMVLVLGMLVVGCPEEEKQKGDDFDIVGAYNFTLNNNECTWVFSSDKTYEIDRPNLQKISGTWSVSGKEITLKTNSAVGALTETFTISENEDKVTLTFKGNAQVSMIFTNISVVGKSLTLTRKAGGDNGDETIEDGVSGDFSWRRTGSQVAITGYNGAGGNVVIPAEINGFPVTSIRDGFHSNFSYFYGVFYSKQLTSIIIPDSITYIGDYSFGENELTSIAIPSSVTTIGDGAFRHNQLTSVTIPNSVTTIGDGAFFVNQLTNVTIPNSVTSIGVEAFRANQLASVTIPNNVTSIEWGAFESNQLTSVTIPSSVTTIGDYAFSSNQLTSVTFEGNIHSNDFYINTFSGDLRDVYLASNGGPGTYTRPNTSTTTWTKQ